MAKVHFVKCARKDNSVVKKGEQYYWWKFNYGAKRYSKTRPRQSQLTQSDFLSQMYSIQERMEDMMVDSDFESEINEIVSDLEALSEETEEKRDNMPEQLQDAPTGEMLQGRVDSIEEMVSELQDIELEVDIDIDDAKEMIGEIEDGESGQEYDLRVEEQKEEMEEEKKGEILQEIQEVGYNGE